MDKDTERKQELYRKFVSQLANAGIDGDTIWEMTVNVVYCFAQNGGLSTDSTMKVIDEEVEKYQKSLKKLSISDAEEMFRNAIIPFAEKGVDKNDVGVSIAWIMTSLLACEKKVSGKDVMNWIDSVYEERALNVY
jgi:hypothetical protein